MKRAAAKETITVNQAVIQSSDDETEEFEDARPPPDTEDVPDTTEIEINQAVSKARKEAHPGDIRRVLSGPAKKRATTQVKFAQWITKDDDETKAEAVMMGQTSSSKTNMTGNLVMTRIFSRAIDLYLGSIKPN